MLLTNPMFYGGQVMDKELQESLEQNVQMWKLWQERGVTESTELKVDYQFICPNKKSLEELSNILKKADFQLTVNKRRLLFFFWEWDLEATTKPQHWSLSKLNDETSKWYKIAEDCNAELDGMGALI